MTTATIDELKAKVGKEIGVSDWLLVDQAMIDKFADATGDRQFIHVDPERAKLTPFGGTIAHGFLTLSLMPILRDSTPGQRVVGAKLGLNYGANRLRFLSPVRSGKRIRARFRLLELVEKRPGQFQETSEMTIEIEGEDKPALIAEWIVQFFL